VLRQYAILRGVTGVGEIGCRSDVRFDICFDIRSDVRANACPELKIIHQILSFWYGTLHLAGVTIKSMKTLKLMGRSEAGHY